MTRNALLVAALFGTLRANADCSHNNCLRAVIGDAFPTRDGLGDCSKYLEMAVTPPMSTFTAIVTVSTGTVIPSTETDGFTVVLPTTVSTETEVLSVTSVIDGTATIVDTITTTTTVDPYVTIVPRDDRNQKAQSAPSGSTYPGYASACSSFPKYASACSCLGAFPSTTTVAAPSTTITVTATTVTGTSTDISTTAPTETDYSSVTATTLLTSTVLATTTGTSTTSTTTVVVVATPLVKNGGFESGKLAPWKNDYPRRVGASITSPGSDSNYALTTALLSNNDLFQLEQTVTSLAGTAWSCSYDWLFTNYYEALYPDGNTYVPYVHVYIDNDIVSNQFPTSASDANAWRSASFTFTSTGSNVLYFDIASPQPPPGTQPPRKGHVNPSGPNYASIDNVGCVQIS